MSASDVSGLIDLATAVDPTPSSPVSTEETVASTPETGETLESPEVASDESADGSEAQAQIDDSDLEKPIDGRTNPAAVRSALKKLRDLGPEYAPIARQLNDSFGRYNAYKSVFPKVADAQNAKALLDAVGGDTGLTTLQETLKNVSATDQKLYSGDPSVIDDILEDMRSEGKIDAFGKLAKPFLEKLRSTDEKAYFETMKPHFFQGLQAVGFQKVVGDIVRALSGDAPNIDAARQTAEQMGQWFEDLKTTVDSSSKQTLDPERQAFEQERTQFHTQRTQEFQKSVATDCDSHNNKALGTALKSYLKQPFFKGFSRESLVDLGAGLKQQLFSELSADKGYQTQMDAFFSQKSPDKAKITAFHQAKVDAMAQRIVRDLLNRRYPNAGKTAIQAKPATKAPVQAQLPGGVQKPVYQTSKPDWNDIDWTKDGQQTAYITGRAILKNGRYVSWNPKDKR